MFTRSVFMVLMLFASQVANAQTVSDYAALMRLFSQAENALLNQKSTLLSQEQGFEDPIWLRDSSGAYRVVSAETYRPKLEALVSIAQLLDLDDAALQQLPLATRMAASLMSENMIASIATDKIMQALRVESATIRRGAMQGFETALEKAQSEFAAALQARDQLLAGDPNAPAFNLTACAQPMPETATVYAWTASGPAYFYWDAGGVFCDTYNYHVVINTGEKLVLYKCSDRARTACERQRTIYKFTENDDGIFWGRTFLSEEDLNTDASSGVFNWRQCRPAIHNLPPC